MFPSPSLITVVLRSCCYVCTGLKSLKLFFSKVLPEAATEDIVNLRVKALNWNEATGALDSICAIGEHAVLYPLLLLGAVLWWQ